MAQRSFGADVAAAFVFIRDKDNLIAWLAIGACYAVGSLATQFGAYLGCLGFVISVIVYGFLFSFCFAVILESASGSDKLPAIIFDDLAEDVVKPLLRFVGTWLYVLAPAVGLAITKQSLGSPIRPEIIIAVVLAGVFFWPATVLSVAIGQGFSGLAPQLVIKTALAAPGSYVIVWLSLVAAWALTSLPYMSFITDAWPGIRPVLWIAVPFVSLYTMIVSMHVIGLYYRHHKDRFPWKAE